MLPSAAYLNWDAVPDPEVFVNIVYE